MDGQGRALLADAMRTIELAETERGFRVSTYCQSRAEAIAVGIAIFNVSPAEAFLPVPGSLDELRVERNAPTPPDESILPPHALASEDEAGPEPMAHDEAVSR